MRELVREEVSERVRGGVSVCCVQLIEDKKKLGEKCEKMVKELRDTSTKYQTKVKTMEEM